ncbi:hypothetical protein F5887DRAFT_1081413 [Amanita rubescens]|nr:hypothetical protein F5887DRAFT_1082627 [Amanita rubescens]KAF8330974.1 hypothetical protein F5887DRAFT_1081413 [Amanita rubescens]
MATGLGGLGRKSAAIHPEILASDSKCYYGYRMIKSDGYIIYFYLSGPHMRRSEILKLSGEVAVESYPTFKALLFPDSSKLPILINIPLIHPSLQPTLQNMNLDMYFEGSTPRVKLVNEFPLGSPLPLKYQYVFFFLSLTDQIVNSCIMNLSAGHSLWFGNVLILKTTKTEEQRLVSITATDRLLAERIVLSLTYGTNLSQSSVSTL